MTPKTRRTTSGAVGDSEATAVWAELFRYPGCDEPAGLIEHGIEPEAIAEISVVAESVKSSLDLRLNRWLDCMQAVAAWEQALASLVGLEVAGGVGVDEPAYDPQHRLIAPESRDGFREGDGLIHRHWWLGLGPDRIIFDPSAIQFMGKGWTRRDRYVMNGQPYDQWRRTRDASPRYASRIPVRPLG